MKLLVFSVRDRGSDMFGNPYSMLSRGQAIRVFGDEVNRAADDNPLYRHPDDFELWFIGEFDTGTGRIVGLSDNEQVVLARDLVVKPNKE